MFDIFKTIPNYTGMLNKLGIFSFFIALATIFYLTESIPELKEQLSQQTSIEVLGTKIPLGQVILAICVALITRITKLHDRISDLLKLRASYDWNYIIRPLAEESGTSIDKRKVMKERSHVTKNIFYKYTSSSIQPPIIRQELIELIMDQLSWSWILLETSVLFLLGTIIILCHSQDYYLPAITTLITFTAGLATLRSCNKYTKQEVDLIIESPIRKNEIRSFLNAL